MSADVTRESYDGGQASVEVFDRAARPFANEEADGRIVLDVVERGIGRAELLLTPAEARHLAVALNIAADEADQATDPQDTRPSGPPVADGRGGGPSELDPAGPACTTEESARADRVLAGARDELLATGTPVAGATVTGCLCLRPTSCVHPQPRIQGNCDGMQVCMDCWRYVTTDQSGTATAVGCGCWPCLRDSTAPAVTS